MIVTEEDFKVLKKALQFFNTSVKQTEQASQLFELDYFQFDPLTIKNFRSMMSTFDKILFGLTEEELEAEDDNILKDW